MPRKCTICRSPNRAAVDAALVAGEPYRYIAVRYGTSMGTLQRHKSAHLAALVKSAAEQEAVQEKNRGESLLDQVRSLLAKACKILDEAKDQRTALVAVREVRNTLELAAKLTGELSNPEADSGPPVPLFVLPSGTQVSVSMTPRPTPPREINVTPEGSTLNSGLPELQSPQDKKEA